MLGFLDKSIPIGVCTLSSYDLPKHLPILVGVLHLTAGLLAHESSQASSLPILCKSEQWCIGCCSSFTVAGPRRIFTELPF